MPAAAARATTTEASRAWSFARLPVFAPRAPIQPQLTDAGRAYIAHVLNQEDATWGGYVEADAIARGREFITRIFHVVNGNLRLMDTIGAGSERNLSLLWNGDHYQVLDGAAALDGVQFDAQQHIAHDPVGDGNCMYEAMFFIMRAGGQHIATRLQNEGQRGDDTRNMRIIASTNIDDALANILGEELLAAEDVEDFSKEFKDEAVRMEVAKAVSVLYDEYPPSQYYVAMEGSSKKAKLKMVARAEEGGAKGDVTTALRKAKIDKKWWDEVSQRLQLDRSYRKVASTSDGDKETKFVSLKADHDAGTYQLVVSKSSKIRMSSGESGFEDYTSGAMTVQEAVADAIANLDLTGSIKLKYSRHDFQPSSGGKINLQIQLGGSKVYRKGKGDTSSTLVVIDEAIFRNSPRWRQVVQAAHRRSFNESSKVEIKEVKKD